MASNPTAAPAPSASQRFDNFLPLRHLAAWLVLFSHSYALAHNPEDDTDFIADLLPGFYAGSLAVHLFFAISGYLVTRSLLRHPGVMRYVRHRCLRVFPGYLGCLFASVFVLGTTFSTWPAGEFLAAPATWEHLGDNLIPISFAWTLPGVFEHNPFPNVVNGSLWSLGLEVRWYFYLGVLAGVGVVRRRAAFTLVAGVVVLIGAWQWFEGKPDPLGYRSLSQTFLLAALFAHWRGSVPVTHAGMVAIVLAGLLLAGTRWFGALAVCGIVYGVLWCAYRVPALRWPENFDLSYGMFLYGFPLQQGLMAACPALTPSQLCLASTLVVLPVAALSWYAVERPALRWRSSPVRVGAGPAQVG